MCPDSPALQKNYFLTEFKLNSAFFKLDKVLRQSEGSLILDNAEEIRSNIFSMNFVSFNIQEDGVSVRKVNATQAVKENPVERDAGRSVIITVSNKDALTYNMAIRRQRYGASNMAIQNGDVLLVCRNSAKNKYFNGDLLTVVDVDSNAECRSINIRGSESAVEIYYRTILVRSVDEEGKELNQQCKVIENLLYKPSSTLSLIENRAMMADFRKRHSNLDVNSEEFRTQLLGDEYFNALLVKFGYAITCHKAQGGEWDNVYVSFSGFPNRNSDFYRWAYTAITRSKRTLGVIDAPSFGDSEIHIAARSSYHEEDVYLQDCNSLADGKGGEHLQTPITLAEICEAPQRLDNRGLKWSNTEDSQLRTEFSSNKSIAEMSVAHGRTKSSIISRLKRLGVIENTPHTISESDPEFNGIDSSNRMAIPADVEGVKPRSGSWKKSELEKVSALWMLSNKEAYSIRSISLETGRSNLAIIIQLFKAKLITLEEGDSLCEKCECPNILSKAILLYQPESGQ
jgi:hypothetical protein